MKTPTQMLETIKQAIENTNAAILATIDEKHRPHMRWVTPVMIKGYPCSIFCLTGALSKKIAQIERQSCVELMIQARMLEQVVTINGHARAYESDTIKDALISTAGQRLTAFWKANADITNYRVIQIDIEQALYYEPMNGYREQVTF